MLNFIATCVFGLTVLILAYRLKQHKVIDNEGARKLVHFVHAISIAAWAVIFGYWFVILAEVVFLGVVVFAREFQIFYALQNVGRKSWGEFFFPIGVIILALLHPHISVFLVALLTAGLADAAAAIIGKRIKSRNYKIFGQRKTLAGSSAFFIVALVVTWLVLGIWSPGLSSAQFWAVLLFIPLLATIIENVSTYGSDNLTVPLGIYAGMLMLGVI